MTLWQAIILGIVQGLTEFLPISSSGHLVFVEHLFGLPAESRELLGFDVLLHAGTALALLICYFRKWSNILLSPFCRDMQHQRLLGVLIVATLPGALAGIFLEEFITEARSLTAVGVGFLITGLVLAMAHMRSGTGKIHSLKIWQILVMGCAQGCALFPGISRSGLTISAGQACGIDRREALDFSFLMALPIITGATVFSLLQVHEGTMRLPSVSLSIIGFLASVVTSIFAIVFLRAFVRRHSLAWFAVYLIPMGGLLVL